MGKSKRLAYKQVVQDCMYCQLSEALYHCRPLSLDTAPREATSPNPYPHVWLESGGK